MMPFRCPQPPIASSSSALRSIASATSPQKSRIKTIKCSNPPLLCSMLILLVLFSPVFGQFRPTVPHHPARRIVWQDARPPPKHAYDTCLGNAIADYPSAQNGLKVTSVRMNDNEQGHPDDLPNDPHVRSWRGHARQNEVKDELAKK